MHILIVEDDPDISQLLVMYFRQRGHEAELEQHGGRARTILRERGGDFDLVISDARLPGASGAELLGCCRNRGLEVPFLLCSGDPGEEVAGVGVAFLVKPFDFEALGSAVARLIGS